LEIDKSRGMYSEYEILGAITFEAWQRVSNSISAVISFIVFSKIKNPHTNIFYED
jgi:hypothetical protein